MRPPDEKHVRRAVLEKDVMLALDSPFHTRLLNTFLAEGSLYLLMEYAPALSLDQQIQWGRGLEKAAIPTVRRGAPWMPHYVWRRARAGSPDPPPTPPAPTYTVPTAAAATSAASAGRCHHHP